MTAALPVEATKCRLGPYPAYRPSDIPWLGLIPEHWAVRRLKHVASLRTSNVDKKSDDNEQTVRLCNYVDVYHHDYISADISFMEATASPDEIRRFRLQQGDVLITKDSEEWNDIAVPAYVDEELDGVVCGYHLAQVRTLSEHAHGEYLFRAFAAHAIRDQFRIAANGITRFGLSRYAVATALFPVPPIEEQKAIARFLRRETARIDALIAKKERLIELLQEKRAALITHAVTKGLNPNAPTKDSGIPWLGQVPSHWTVVPLKWISAICNGATPRRDETDYWQDGDVPWVSSGEVNQFIVTEPTALITSKAVHECSLRIIKRGAVLIGMVGEGKTRGTTARLAIDACINQNVAAIQPGPKLDGNFLHYAAIQGYEPIRNCGRGGQQDALNCDIVGNVQIPLPPRPEQEQIAEYINKATALVNGLIEQLAESIVRAKEYRSALISAAVTGKIDLREDVYCLSDTVENADMEDLSKV